jgi:hypothetical protein
MKEKWYCDHCQVTHGPRMKKHLRQVKCTLPLKRERRVLDELQVCDRGALFLDKIEFTKEKEL